MLAGGSEWQILKCCKIKIQIIELALIEWILANKQGIRDP
jgi:hypothetical protein